MRYELILELGSRKIAVSGDKDIENIIERIDKLIVESMKESEEYGG